MFAIRTRPTTYYCGRTNQGRQILLGWVKDHIAVLEFDELGNLTDVTCYPVSADTRQGLGPEVEHEVDEQIVMLLKRYGVKDSPIAIRPFSVENLGVELKELPEDIEDFMLHPEKYDDEAHVYREDLARWR